MNEAAVTSACAPSSYIVSTYARTQYKWYYCGPTVVQVIVNRTRGYYFEDEAGAESTTHNYRKQTTIASYMGTESILRSDAPNVKTGLNGYANLSHTGTYIPFTIYENITTGALFHSKMITATYSWRRGAAVPVRMTFASQHLASWGSQTWWNAHSGDVVLHWIAARGYNGYWDGTYTPKLYYSDSSSGFGGDTGNFTDPSRRVFELNNWHSKRIVY